VEGALVLGGFAEELGRRLLDAGGIGRSNSSNVARKSRRRASSSRVEAERRDRAEKNASASIMRAT
jgi:hypothetical protein